MEKGPPNNPRFPERDTEWVNERKAQNDLLLQWLEGFKASFGDNPAAKETLEECENALNLYTKVIEAIRIPLAVKSARRAKRADGSILEYGLDFHLKNFNGSVSKYLHSFLSQF